jgi:isopropylmalate/homocitrate/citramalate synthase
MGKFSDFLIKQKLIDPEKDEQAVFKAMSKVASRLISPPPIPRSDSSNPKDPLSSLMSKHNEAQKKLEERRKLQNAQELSQLQSKPSINKNSSKLVKNIPPLHLRTGKLLKDLESKIESQRVLQRLNEEEAFSKSCTFRPSSRCSRSSLSSTRERSPSLLTQELYTWNEEKQKKILKKRKEKEKEEKKKQLNKPKIDEISQKISQTV